MSEIIWIYKQTALTGYHTVYASVHADKYSVAHLFLKGGLLSSRSFSLIMLAEAPVSLLVVYVPLDCLNSNY